MKLAANEETLMGLPSPQLLAELSDILDGSHQSNKMGFWSEKDQRAELARLGSPPPAPGSRPTLDKAAYYAKKGVGTAAPKLAATAGSALIHGGVSVGGNVNVLHHAIPMTTTLAPFGSAITAWISMATVAVQAGKVLDLYTLRDDARGGKHGATVYYCNCTQCEKNIQYIIDKKERNVGVVAVSVGTLGVAGILKIFHSTGKKLKSMIAKEVRPKEQVSRDLITSGKENGCLAALATIFLLSGSWTNGYRDKSTMEAAVLTLTAVDGWKKLKDNW